ncbi:MAG TPA: HD domain-containing protein [Solirubrobacteraceae bacterium]|jgi:3'-5' exoribonuclease|nr:HD domain-containing protein [Solirubrobacteraceae bacterium]
MSTTSSAPIESADTQTTATLRAGDPVDAVFACVRKERQLARSGAPYLTVELRDQSGTITGRAFRDADLLAGRFERGELVRVQGRVELFREELQIAVELVARVELTEEQAARFLPVSHRDLDELEGFLEHLTREVYEPGLKGLLERLLGDRELRAELRRAPCSLPSVGPNRTARPSAHHAFLGGLLEHTVAVATMAVELCAVHPRLDRDLLLSAALVHDLGKTREYAYGAEITRTEEGRMLGHVELGLRLIAIHIPPMLAPDRRLALEHCVIAHHSAEGAGGQRFASAEALALQRLNALDAGVKGAFEQGLGR